MATHRNLPYNLQQQAVQMEVLDTEARTALHDAKTIAVPQQGTLTKRMRQPGRVSAVRSEARDPLRRTRESRLLGGTRHQTGIIVGNFGSSVCH